MSDFRDLLRLFNICLFKTSKIYQNVITCHGFIPGSQVPSDMQNQLNDTSATQVLRPVGSAL